VLNSSNPVSLIFLFRNAIVVSMRGHFPLKSREESHVSAGSNHCAIGWTSILLKAGRPGKGDITYFLLVMLVRQESSGKEEETRDRVKGRTLMNTGDVPFSPSRGRRLRAPEGPVLRSGEVS
jgi:hypothetical protein